MTKQLTLLSLFGCVLDNSNFYIRALFVDRCKRELIRTAMCAPVVSVGIASSLGRS